MIKSDERMNYLIKCIWTTSKKKKRVNSIRSIWLKPGYNYQVFMWILEQSYWVVHFLLQGIFDQDRTQSLPNYGRHFCLSHPGSPKLLYSYAREHCNLYPKFLCYCLHKCVKLLQLTGLTAARRLFYLWNFRQTRVRLPFSYKSWAHISQ